jgi:D-arabinose 1-dehydrogenase-like Zn-dependent alcohol dehydrogenase
MTKSNVILTVPEPNKFELAERPYPKIKGGYVIVRNEFAGVCLEGSRIWAKHHFEKFYGGGQSDYPDGLGHESVGVVEEVHSGSNLRPGDRVIIFQGDWCGQCHACMNALSPTYCAANTFPPKQNMKRVGLAGIQDWNESESGGWAMAQYRIAAEPHVIKIPDNLDFKYAQAANCSVGVGWSNQELMDVRPGSTVMVTGVGFITMGHVIAALHRNCTIIALIRNKYRQEILAKMGVEHFIDPIDEDWLDKVKSLTFQGVGVDYCIDGSGHPFYQEKCLQATHPYGKINFSGHIPGQSFPLENLKHIIDPGNIIMGQHDVNMRDRESLVKMLCDSNVQKNIDAMVTHVFPMSRAGEAFDIQVSKQCGKIFLQPQL